MATSGVQNRSKRPVPVVLDDRSFKRSRVFHSLGSEIINLEVGPESFRINVHKDVLCGASPFFEAACKPEWLTADGPPVIKLPDDQKDVMQALVFWMYNDEVFVTKEISEFRPDGNHAEHTRTSHAAVDWTEKTVLKGPWGLFANLFVTARKYQMPGLQNDAMDAFLTETEGASLSLCLVPFVYANTLAGSPLRRLTIAYTRQYLAHQELEEYEEESKLPPEFFMELAISFMKDKEEMFDEEMYPERYHDYENYKGNVGFHTLDWCKEFHRHETKPFLCKDGWFKGCYHEKLEAGKDIAHPSDGTLYWRKHNHGQQ